MFSLAAIRQLIKQTDEYQELRGSRASGLWPHSSSATTCVRRGVRAHASTALRSAWLQVASEGDEASGAEVWAEWLLRETAMCRRRREEDAEEMGDGVGTS